MGRGSASTGQPDLSGLFNWAVGIGLGLGFLIGLLVLKPFTALVCGGIITVLAAPQIYLGLLFFITGPFTVSLGLALIVSAGLKWFTTL